jgi:hypothetical protein
MSAISSTQASYLTSQISNNQLLFPIAGQTAGTTPLPAADLGTSPVTYSPSAVTPQSALEGAYAPADGSSDAATLAALGVTSSGDSYAGESTLATAPAASTASASTTSTGAAGSGATSSTPASTSSAAPAAPTYAGESVLSAKAATTPASSASTASATTNAYETQYDNALVTNDETLLSGIVGPYGIGTGTDSSGLYGFGTSVGNNVDTLV